MIDEYTDRLRAIFSQATEDDLEEGIGWYATAHSLAKDIAYRCDMTVDQVAGVIAALSPQNRWPSNLVDAAAYCEAARAGRTKPTARTFSLNQDRAWVIATGVAGWREVLKGPKVRAFAANISGDLGPVTVDLWATRAATGDPKAGSPKNEKQRKAIVHSYAVVAGEVGLDPAEFQAVIWCIIRKQGGIPHEQR